MNYKGFEKDMTCRGFQYEEGKEYEEPLAEVCEAGFHSCEYPLDCFSYYDPAHSVYHEVEASGEIDRDNDDTKIASTKLKIGAEINIAGMVKAAIEYTVKRTKNEAGADKKYGASSATGSCGASSATGYKGASSAMDSTAVAVAWGPYAKARGVIGAHLIFAERLYKGDPDDWDYNKANAKLDKWDFKGAKMVRVDGETIKKNVWYTLKDGNIEEVEEEDDE